MRMVWSERVAGRLVRLGFGRAVCGARGGGGVWGLVAPGLAGAPGPPRPPPRPPKPPTGAGWSCCAVAQVATQCPEPAPGVAFCAEAACGNRANPAAKTMNDLARILRTSSTFVITATGPTRTNIMARLRIVKRAPRFPKSRQCPGLEPHSEFDVPWDFL